MSAISLSSVDEPSPATSYGMNYTAYPEKTMRSNTQPAGVPTMQSVYQQKQQPVSDRTMPTTTGGQRSRTYSTPYGNVNGHANGAAVSKMASNKSPDPSRSLSPRPTDVKPTRIPKASRPPGTSSSSTSPHFTPELAYQPKPQLVHSASKASTVEISAAGNQHTPVLLNESPPFPTHATMSSGFDQEPPRPSMDSEERPFEHWYRGEVSRNGGVGELRVGRRQEMLDIANYGHLIGNRKGPAPVESPAERVVARHRQRAGSIAGLTNKERERGSVYLDDEHANEVGRVLDEYPPTDLDEAGSDTYSVDDQNIVAYAYIPGETDDWIHNARSTTPTPSMLPRPSSRQQQQQQVLPTRIPGPASRRSSESRSTSTMSPQTVVGMSRYGEFGASSSTANTTPSPPSIQSTSSKQAYTTSTVPNHKQPQKRGASPAASTPSKKAKPRPSAGRAATQANIAGKKKEESSNHRSSVAQYPTPDGDEDDMADAIPSWTQPVPREGNWDEVRTFPPLYELESRRCIDGDLTRFSYLLPVFRLCYPL